MLYPKKLLKTKLIKRYKRFISEYMTESDNVLKANCANPGSMFKLLRKRSYAWCLRAQIKN